MTILLILVSSFLLQEKQTIQKAHKGPYIEVVNHYQEATRAFREDAFAKAIKLVDEVLGNQKIEKWECILRIEQTPGTWYEYEFFPYQLRGRIRLAQAGKNPDIKSAIDTLELARKDFEDSIRLGLHSSRAFLEKSKNQIEIECRKWLDLETQDFLQNLENAEKKEDITRPRNSAFRRTFLLPSREDLSCTTPAYEWCMTVYHTLLEMRDGKDVLGNLLDHAVNALTLVPEGDNGWYHWAEGLAYSIVKIRLTKNTGKAREAPRNTREGLRKESEALRDRWNRFEKLAREDSNFRSRKIDSLVRFPEEYPGVEKLQIDLEHALARTDFRKALVEFELNLQDPGDNLAIESRREILRCRIAAGALLRLYDRISVDQSAKELKSLGLELKNLEGSFEMNRFGPRVEEVFSLLRRDS